MIRRYTPAGGRLVVGAGNVHSSDGGVPQIVRKPIVGKPNRKRGQTGQPDSSVSTSNKVKLCESFFATRDYGQASHLYYAVSMIQTTVPPWIRNAATNDKLHTGGIDPSGDEPSPLR